MDCPYCKQELTIGKFDSEITKDCTRASKTRIMLCRNPNCSMYAGEDLNNPIKTVKIDRQCTKITEE